MNTIDHIADTLAQTYASINGVLDDARTRLQRTQDNAEIVCAMDPGLRLSLENDLRAAERVLRQLIAAASGAGSALSAYAEAVRAGRYGYALAGAKAIKYGADLGVSILARYTGPAGKGIESAYELTSTFAGDVSAGTDSWSAAGHAFHNVLAKEVVGHAADALGLRGFEPDLASQGLSQAYTNAGGLVNIAIDAGGDKVIDSGLKPPAGAIADFVFGPVPE